ncbi:hypothetical protein LXL04_008288 [Taraxacum kok-saghyz]
MDAVISVKAVKDNREYEFNNLKFIELEVVKTAGIRLWKSLRVMGYKTSFFTRQNKFRGRLRRREIDVWNGGTISSKSSHYLIAHSPSRSAKHQVRFTVKFGVRFRAIAYWSASYVPLADLLIHGYLYLFYTTVSINCYFSSLLSTAYFEVDIFAYGGSDPHSALLEKKSIHIHTMVFFLFTNIISHNPEGSYILTFTIFIAF